MHKPYYCQKLCSLGYIFAGESMCIGLQVSKQFCLKATKPLDAEPETAFEAK